MGWLLKICYVNKEEKHANYKESFEGCLSISFLSELEKVQVSMFFETSNLGTTRKFKS